MKPPRLRLEALGKPGDPREDEPVVAASSLTSQVRIRAREQAAPLSGAAVLIAATLGAIALVMVFVALDYVFRQDPHRLAKILAGAAMFTGLVTLPKVGLLLVPVVTPLLELFPKLPIPGVNTANALFFTVFFSYALANVLRRKPVMRKGSLALPIGLLVLIAGLSIVRGAAFPTGLVYEPGPAFFAWFRAAMSFGSYFVALAMVRGEKERRWMTWALLAGFAAETAFTFKFGRDLRGRATGTIGQANELGTYLALFTVFALAVGFGMRRWWQKLVVWGLMVAGTAGVFMSVSRGAMLALAVGAMVVAARTSRLLIVLMVLALGTSPLWAPDYVKERVVTTVMHGDDSDVVELEGGTEARINTWQSIFRIVESHPLDGIGFGGLADVLPQIGAELGLMVKDSAHNTFLRLLAETGVAGLVAVLALFWMAWRLSLRGARAPAGRFDRQVSIGLGGMVVALALSCAFGDRLWEIMITGNFWFACALVEDAVLERRRAARAHAVPPRGAPAKIAVVPR